MDEMSKRSREILEFIEKEPRQTPQSISDGLELAPSTVKNTLVTLMGLSLLEKKARGLYEISRLGERLLRELETRNLKYWMALNDFELDNSTFDLREFLGKEDFLNLLQRNYEMVGSNTDDMPRHVREKLAKMKKWISNIDIGRYARARNDLENRGVRVISYLDEDYPQSLKERDPLKYPRVLYHKGSPLDFKNYVAVVGTRNPSKDQVSKVRELSGFLADKDFTIVSGLALGVDTIAHKGALDASGKTIAVLPNIGKITPEGNRELAQKIVENDGALLAIQFDPSKLSKHKWVKRNRVISGISQAICAFASLKSKGTYHQIRFAIEQGVKVLTLRTDDEEVIFEKMRYRGARIVDSKEDLLDYLGKDNENPPFVLQ